MLTTNYATSFDFMEGTANHHPLIKSAYARNNAGINSHMECWFPDDNTNIKHAVLSSLPILGTLRGIARLYSIYSVKDRSEDTIANILIHTITGILETLGLGILVLIAKMLALFLLVSIFFVGTKLGIKL